MFDIPPEDERDGPRGTGQRPSRPGPGAVRPKVPPGFTDRIGEGLRSYYLRLMDEPVPEHLIRIVQDFDMKGGARDDD